MKPTVARLQEAFSYDPSTGELRWRIRPVNSVKIGQIAGKLSGEIGRRQICIDGVDLYATHIIWALQTGDYPPPHLVVDHVNRIPSDDRWENLRIITKSEDNENRSAWRRKK